MTVFERYAGKLVQFIYADTPGTPNFHIGNFPEEYDADDDRLSMTPMTPEQQKAAEKIDKTAGITPATPLIKETSIIKKNVGIVFLLNI